MHIASLTLSGFQCFGSEPTVVPLDRLTACIGANGTGKTAVLQALCRLFGTTNSARRLTPDDFHVPAWESRDAVAERTLFIEARLEFPELPAGLDAGSDEGEGTVPAFFRQMVISEPGGVPHCRLRLEGTWTRSSLAEGDVDEEAYWVRGAPGTPGEVKDRARADSRHLVQVHYVPASRDAVRQLANTSGTLLHQLLRAVNWGDALKQQVRDAAGALGRAFREFDAIRRLDEANLENWAALYDEHAYRNPTLKFVAGEIEDLVRGAHVVFNPTHGARDHDLTRLSDGQRSLFYFAFLATLFGLHREVYASHHGTAALGDEAGPDPAGQFHFDELRPAALTVFAVEEPENHLAPHYLGRIAAQLERLAGAGGVSGGTQVVLTTHAPAIVTRVAPESLRHFRTDVTTGCSVVRRITLPADGGEDGATAKYVREAIQSYPELYFARLVVLVEGDSEEIVLPRLVRAAGGELDLAFVSVVPLGGRHVNHFWRLLNDLRIPHVTLLDLDHGRSTGGWRTIHYVVGELRKVLDAEAVDRLRREPAEAAPGGVSAPLTDAALDELSLRPADDASSLDAWVAHLRGFDVFLSAPLDVDLLMLRAYPEAYQATAERGPRGGRRGDDLVDGHDGGPGDAERVEAARRRMFGKRGGESYPPELSTLFPWYVHLFLDRGKPASHAAAWAHVPSGERAARTPEPLRALLDRVRSLVFPGARTGVPAGAASVRGLASPEGVTSVATTAAREGLAGGSVEVLGAAGGG